MIYDYLNLFLVIFGGVVTIACMFGPARVLGHLRYDTKPMYFLLGINLIYLLSVGLKTHLNGLPGTHVNLMMNVTNFLQYFMLYLLSNTVTFYVGYRIKENGLTRLNVRPFLYIYIIPYGLLFLNIYNKMYYYIGSDNVYYRSPLFPLSQILGAVIHLLGLYLYIRYYKYVDDMTRHLILPFLILPIVVTVIQIFVRNLAMMAIATTISCFMFVIGGLQYWRNQVNENQNQLEQLEVTMKFGKLDSNFLYATLEDISLLCKKNPREASRIMDCLADYLRKSMNDKERAGIENFEEELEHLKNYLSIIQLRCGERFQVDYQIEVVDFELPTRVLQQLAECMVRYVLSRAENEFVLSIHTYRKEAGCYIDMMHGNYNPRIEKRKQDASEIQDMDDIRTRLRYIPKAHLTYECLVETGTRYQVFIPDLEDAD